MIVSWNWLKTYLPLDVPPGDVEQRLMMAGLNHEQTDEVDGDLAIDLEVTSNRPDCLGHLGVAREIAVLFDLPLTIPPASPAESGPPVAELTRVTIQADKLCDRYTARVIRGVQVGPSPAWLVERLRTVGLPSINNVVDITNYVLLECGQPLHAFDLATLAGPEIIVRDANPGEPFTAINHRQYTLEPGMCVIADARRAVALGGVMGGADTEVTSSTSDLLIESAGFDPMAIRAVARKLNLHSDSSYRFERGVDPQGIDWASRRCCELVLELCGGQLATGSIDVGAKPRPRRPVVLRLAQLKRILGIDIQPDTARRILAALGNVEQKADATQVTVVPPSWRADLTREIDLIEEVARIHGYDKIPEDLPVAMVPSTRRTIDRVTERVRHVLTAAGYDEAMTVSAVDEELSESFSPWTDAAPLRTSTPVLRRADRLRRTVVPSLLEARRANEALSNDSIELFELAHVYLPRPGGLPDEQLMLAAVGQRDYLSVKGVIEALVSALDPSAELHVAPMADPMLDEQASARLSVGGRQLGYLGELSAAGRERFNLRERATVAEIHVARLVEIAQLIRPYAPQPAYPPIDRDLNLVVDESVRWSDLAATVRQSAGEHLEQLEYRDTYRNAKDPQLAGDKKSLLLTLRLRSRQRTLTGEEADAIREAIVTACATQHGAELRK